MPDADSLSVIIPTYNEIDNIADVLGRALATLNRQGLGYEILVVDDASDDHTAEAAEKAIATKGRVLRRSSGTRSLSLSVLEAIKQARGDIIVVMDADGSHPPELIPELVMALRQGYNLAIASRYTDGGSTEGFPLTRRLISRTACIIGGIVTRVRDNTSGFFCLRKKILDGLSLAPSGFKIGLEIFVKVDPVSFKEIPYTFVDRKKGKSKLRATTCLQYLCQVLGLLKFKIARCRTRLCLF